MFLRRQRTLLLAIATLLFPASLLFGQSVSPQRLLPNDAMNAADAAETTRGEIATPLLKTPALFVPQGTEMPKSQAQKAVFEAEKHFQYGKFCIQEGKPEEARREFDLAIDLLMEVPENVPDHKLVEDKFEELVRQIHRYDVERLGAGVNPSQPQYPQSPLEGILELTFPIDPKQKDTALSVVKATQSQLPLTVNDAVLSYVNYFTSERGQRTLYYGLRRAGRYKAMISRILDEEGVPQELIHLAQAESAFQARALSYKAAAGMWQFVRWRGQEYGLMSSQYHDDRLDPEKATRAAARHLRDLYNQLGDWHLAMAGYNCGPLCVERAVQRTGYADFWELRRRNVLPRETSNYVPAILAMAMVTKNLAAYGLAPVTDEDRPLEYDTVKMSAKTNLALIADAADVPLSDVQDLNPALFRNLAPEGADVRVPKAKGPAVVAALEAVPEDKRSAWRLHRVNAGDTLASIARRYSTAANSIMAANTQIERDFFDSPEDGEILLIPAQLRESGPTWKGAGKSKSAKRAASSKRASSKYRAASKKSSPAKQAKSRSAKAPVKVASASTGGKQYRR
jgi:membrane-bound lytic murein transglycosylase D